MREMDPSCLGSVELVSLRLGLVLVAFGDVVESLGQGVVVHTSNPGTLGAQADTWGQCGLYSESLSQNKKKQTNKNPRQQGKTDGLDKFYSSRIYLKDFLGYMQGDLRLRKLIIDSRRNWKESEY